MVESKQTDAMKQSGMSEGQKDTHEAWEVLPPELRTNPEGDADVHIDLSGANPAADSADDAEETQRRAA